MACFPASLASVVALLLIVGLSPASALADAVPGEMIVHYEGGIDAGERADALDQVGARSAEGLPLPRTELVQVDRRADLDEAAKALEKVPGVAYAEPNGIFRLQALPDDPEFREQWGLRNIALEIQGLPGLLDADIDAPEAWDLTTGSASIPVAVLDSGMDFTHPDLAANVWRNGAELNGRPGVDDDDNGYLDDSIGWDFVARSPAPWDLSGHGTHVAGTIGARGNNGVGVTGVEWKSALMPLRICDAHGECDYAAAVRAIAYASDQGARVINGSFAGPDSSDAIRSAIRSAPDSLFVFSAGNYGADTGRHPTYPCAYNEPNLICTTATGPLDGLLGIANYGSAVDIAAPGEEILSTYARNLDDGAYAYMDGTSMAAPQVSGAAALVWSRFPDESVSQVRTRLLQGADHPGLLQGLAGAGRLNVARAMDLDPPAPVRPDTVITAGPKKRSRSRVAQFSFRSTAGRSFDCRLDGKRRKPCSSPLRIKVRTGTHRFEVRAWNGEGLVDASPASMRFRVKR